MFCTNCGSQIPDGSKFCTNCGAAQAENAPTYEPVSSMMPEAPVVPDPVPPADPWFPEPTPDASAEETPSEPAPSAPSEEPFAAFDAAAKDSLYVSQEPPKAPAASDWSAPAAPAAPNPGGWSIPGEGGYTGPSAPAAGPISTEKSGKSKTGLIIALGAVAVVVIAIILIVASLVSGPKAEETAAPAGGGTGITRPDLSARAGAADQPIDADLRDVVEDALGKPAEEPAEEPAEAPAEEPAEEAAEESAEESAEDIAEAFAAELAGDELTFAQCVDYVQGQVLDTFGESGSDGVGWFVRSDDTYGEDGEGWIDVYLWEDGILDWAFDAYDGNEESLESWKSTLDSVAYMDGDLQSYLDSHGRSGSTVCLNLVDQEEYEYLLAFTLNGEVIYDQVTGIDVWGIRDSADDGE